MNVFRATAGAVLRRVLAAFVLAVAGCATPAVDKTPVEPEMLALTMRHFGYRLEFADTQPLIKARDWAGLAALSLKRAEREPKRGEWWQAAGYGQLRAGDFAAARRSLETAAGLLPEEVEVWNLLAVAQARGGDARGALRTLDRALQTDPVSTIALVLTGDLEAEAGRVVQAGRAYGRALEIDRRDLFAWRASGELARRLNDKTALEAAIKALAQLYPPWAARLAEPEKPAR